MHLNFQFNTLLRFTTFSTALGFRWIFKYLDNFANRVYVGKQFYERSSVLYYNFR